MTVATPQIAQFLGLSETELMRNALRSLLLEQKRAVLQTRLEILARYRATDLAPPERLRLMYTGFMDHRHLTHQEYTLAALDDIIARGRRRDWAALRTALLTDPSIRAKVLRVCAVHITDPYAQRYHFWNHYAQREPA